MNVEEITAAAKAAPEKVRLEDYREAVEALREKGYTWREVAAFLTERGVPTDHTRVYRLFGQSRKQRRTESRAVEIARMTFLGEKPTKKNNAWKVLEIEMPSKLGSPILVQGFAMGGAGSWSALREGSDIVFRDATLVTRSGNRGFPVAHLEAEIELPSDSWSKEQIYIAPLWERLL